jgi:hypothetical protein
MHEPKEEIMPTEIIVMASMAAALAVAVGVWADLYSRGSSISR